MTEPTLDTFDSADLPPNEAYVASQFRRLMSFMNFNIPSGLHLDTATAKLLESRNECLQAMRPDAAVLDMDVVQMELFEDLAVATPPGRSLHRFAHRGDQVPGTD